MAKTTILKDGVVYFWCGQFADAVKAKHWIKLLNVDGAKVVTKTIKGIVNLYCRYENEAKLPIKTIRIGIVL